MNTGLRSDGEPRRGGTVTRFGPAETVDDFAEQTLSRDRSGTSSGRSDSNQTKGPVVAEKSGRSRAEIYASRIVDNKYFVGLTTILTIVALCGDDIRVLGTTIYFDPYYNWVIIFMFIVFLLELIMSCIGKDDYWLGFFFWLDLVSTLSLPLDVTYVMPWLSGSSEDGTGSSDARAGRAARGAKAGRVLRVLRLVRILKLYKAYYEAQMREREKRRRAEAANQEGADDDWSDEDMEDATKDDQGDNHGAAESRVGKKLSETTTRRVICLILAMLLTLPLLQVDVHAATSAEFGADYLLQTFIYMKENKVSRAEYEKAMLHYIYYHNWFAKMSQFCSSENCASQYYGTLFWFGIQGSDRAAVETNSIAAELQLTTVESFNQNATSSNIRYQYGTMPAEAQQLLGGTWDGSCDEDLNIAPAGILREKIAGSRRGISVLKNPIENVVGRAVPCPADLRSDEIGVYFPRLLSDHQHAEWNFIFYFDLRTYTREAAVFNIFTTVFVLMLLVLGSLMFSNDAKRLVINPVEKMIKRVEAIRDNPLIAIKMADEEFKAEEIAKAKVSRQNKERAKAALRELLSGSLCSAKGGQQPMETVVLEKTIIKLGSLLALGFGEAGANIIGHNMRGSDTAGVNAMIPGTHVDCVIGVARIRDFSTATEVLQAKIMTFVNQVAEIVHGVVNDFHGAPNKNNGDFFLIIWRLDNRGYNKSKRAVQTRFADMSLAAFALILGSVHRSPLLADYRAHPGLQNRLGSHCRVNLSFGLHLGWAIEGAVGSEFKIDASYLSPNVSIATSVERATETYGVSLLVAQSVIERCSSKMVMKCRLIDHVIMSGSVRTMGLYCLDLDYLSVQVSQDPPLAIVWNTRNRFKARQFLESEKNSKLAEDFDVAAIFDVDPTVRCMRAIYSVEFFQLFKMGFQNYVEGEWQVARRMLSCMRRVLGVEDGPSNALMSFMESPHNFEAPKDWKGVREVDPSIANAN